MRASLMASVVLMASAMPPSVTAAMADPLHEVRVSTAPLTDLSSQSTRRARTRIRVTPLRRGGRLVRECDFHLAREVRASGTYIVPRQRCWWARR